MAVSARRATTYSCHRSSPSDAGTFTRDQFRYDPAENAYYCPEGKPLRYRGERRGKAMLLLDGGSAEAVRRKNTALLLPFATCRSLARTSPESLAVWSDTPAYTRGELAQDRSPVRRTQAPM